MTDSKTAYLSAGDSVADAERGQIFGKPCFKISGKAFASFFEDEMVFKLPGTIHREALELAGAKLFDPSGKDRPMREWVQVPFAHKDRWAGLAGAAADYANPARD